MKNRVAEMASADWLIFGAWIFAIYLAVSHFAVVWAGASLPLFALEPKSDESGGWGQVILSIVNTIILIVNTFWTKQNQAQSQAAAAKMESIRQHQIGPAADRHAPD